MPPCAPAWGWTSPATAPTSGLDLRGSLGLWVSILLWDFLFYSHIGNLVQDKQDKRQGAQGGWWVWVTMTELNPPPGCVRWGYWGCHLGKEGTGAWGCSAWCPSRAGDFGSSQGGQGSTAGLGRHTLRPHPPIPSLSQCHLQAISVLLSHLVLTSIPPSPHSHSHFIHPLPIPSHPHPHFPPHPTLSQTQEGRNTGHWGCHPQHDTQVISSPPTHRRPPAPSQCQEGLSSSSSHPHWDQLSVLGMLGMAGPSGCPVQVGGCPVWARHSRPPPSPLAVTQPVAAQPQGSGAGPANHAGGTWPPTPTGPRPVQRATMASKL